MDVMEALRTKFSSLASELEVMLTEIGVRFVPLPEERLLAVVHALLQRCYKYPNATTAEVRVKHGRKSCRFECLRLPEERRLACYKYLDRRGTGEGRCRGVARLPSCTAA